VSWSGCGASRRARAEAISCACPHRSVKSSDVLQGAITSAAVAGALVGSSLIFIFQACSAHAMRRPRRALTGLPRARAQLGERIGRRREMLVGAALYVAGSIMEVLSGEGCDSRGRSAPSSSDLAGGV
jgi:hypothetical protein